jgi:hypothetical protein
MTSPYYLFNVKLQLLNAIINFIKTDLKKAIEELNKNAPDLVKKVLDDIQQALPPQLQSLIMGSPIILINNQYLILHFQPSNSL